MKTFAEQKELLIARLAEGESPLEISKKQSDKIFKVLADMYQEDLIETGKSKVPGIGTLEVRYRAARNGVNPSTGEALPIPESLGVGFSAGKSIKDVVSVVDIAPYREAYLAKKSK